MISRGTSISRSLQIISWCSWASGTARGKGHFLFNKCLEMGIVSMDLLGDPPRGPVVPVVFSRISDWKLTLGYGSVYPGNREWSGYVLPFQISCCLLIANVSDLFFANIRNLIGILKMAGTIVLFFGVHCSAYSKQGGTCQPSSKAVIFSCGKEAQSMKSSHAKQ